MLKPDTQHTTKTFMDRILPNAEFTFDLGDDIVTAWVSYATALEVISVNDQTISTRRSVRFKTAHEFELNGHKYNLDLRLVGPSYVNLRAQLRRDGSLLERQEAGLFSTQAPRNRAMLLLIGLVGMAIGYSAGYLILHLLEG